jgi:(4S)-4-hydroxy-5-phosphonooxypentane-2,3-dione isomerase
MHVVIIDIHVKTESISEFQKICIDNAANSLKEPGIVRFDVLQEPDNLAHFTLVEVYKRPEDQALHRETAHYARWKEKAADMMAVPRVATKFANIYPEDGDWKK